jgi:hypothetical protein
METEVINVSTAPHSAAENGVRGHSQEKCDTSLPFTTSWTLENIYLCMKHGGWTLYIKLLDFGIHAENKEYNMYIIIQLHSENQAMLWERKLITI